MRTATKNGPHDTFQTSSFRADPDPDVFMLALVTGGGGFLGRYIVEQLQARGDRVRIFARGPYPELSQQGVQVMQGDIRDPAAVRQAVQEVEAVFHVAAIPGIWGRWQTYYEVNTRGTENVIAACREEGVSRFIYTSSPSVVYDGHPHLNADESLPYPGRYLCHYPHSKALAEKGVLAAHDPGGLRTISLRPHLIWGPRDPNLIPRLLARARSGRLRRIGDGDNVVSVSYVENTAAAHLQAHDALLAGANCGGRAYFINEPDPVPLWTWIDQILAMAQLPPVRGSISPRLAYGIGAACEVVYALLRREREPPMTRFLASQLSQSHSYSVAAAERDFGYSPVVPFAEGMRRLAGDIERMARSC
jgi:nucleoside-diphosphate-sugar epimerase